MSTCTVTALDNRFTPETTASVLNRERQVRLPTIASPTVPVPTATTSTDVTLFPQLQAYCNVTVWVRNSQRCNLFLFLTLSLTLTLALTLYVAIGSVGITLVGMGTAPPPKNVTTTSNYYDLRSTRGTEYRKMKTGRPV